MPLEVVLGHTGVDALDSLQSTMTQLFHASSTHSTIAVHDTQKAQCMAVPYRDSTVMNEHAFHPYLMNMLALVQVL